MTMPNPKHQIHNSHHDVALLDCPREEQLPSETVVTDALVG